MAILNAGTLIAILRRLGLWSRAVCLDRCLFFSFFVFVFYTGSDSANFLILDFATARVAAEVTSMGAAFQILAASMLKLEPAKCSLDVSLKTLLF